MKRVRGPQKADEQGAATLVVVMMLFLVMALLAAYANRGLMFEQRIASSAGRAALSQEVAEGGIEWALAQLNGPAIDANCKPQAVGGQRFVDRYLQINPADRSIGLNSTPPWVNLFADCTRDVANQGWMCRCPAIKTRTPPTVNPAADFAPSFGLRANTGSRGAIEMISVGCTDSVVDNCTGNNVTKPGNSHVAVATFHSTIALVSAVRTPPAAPLVVRGNLDMALTGLGLHNTDPRSAGLLLTIGGVWTGMKDSRMESVPGTAANQVRVQNDPTLKAAASADDVFKMFMGAAPTRYVQHPSLRTVSCAGDCADALAMAYDAGMRILWVEGPMSFGSNKIIGSLTDPVLIIAKGDVTLDGPFILNGMLVATGNLAWNNTGGATSLINGIVLVGGGMQTNGAMDIVYQQAIADQLTNRMGSFVRVPGGWMDGS